MAKSRRFRDVKQKKPLTEEPVPKKRKGQSAPSDGTLPFATIQSKVKAFITDSFMLLMPIMYAVVYLMMDGLQDFSQHKMEGWLAILIPNFIVVFLFFWKSGQTPGCRAYDIKLVDSATGGKPHPLAIALRFYFELLSIVSVIGLLMAFFRKDHKCLHDLLSGTVLVQVESTGAP
jgi:uncharacterized RDD family membrane protein YckC